MTTDSFGELDDIGFLRDAELFQNMSEPVIRTILLQGQLVDYPAGSVVVRRGELGDSLFVVKSGVVEVVNPMEEGAPLVYLGRGECFGELALLTGSVRNADVRVPEQAELLVIDRALFDELAANHPGFGFQLAVILARRLIKLLERAPEGGKKELQGNLRYFDLSTVIQTLISSGQTGVMRLLSHREALAELYFEAGNVYRAEYGGRSGDEAVHQLFQSQPDGEFRFSSTTERVGEADPTITSSAMILLMDSIRLQDELAVVRKQLPADSTLLERTTDALDWGGEPGEREALAIFERLKRPARVAELLAGSSSCHYHSAQILIRLLETEQIMPALHAGTS